MTLSRQTSTLTIILLIAAASWVVMLVPNQLMKSVSPIYPETARRLNMTGSVTVEAQIGADGKVKQVKVVEGEPMLARAAVVAVKQWKYRPSYLNGEPVESSARVVLNFKPQTAQ